MKKEKEVLDKCDEINNEYGINFQKYDSEEKFKKNWGYITCNLAKYIEIEKIKKEDEKKKNKLYEDFAKNLKEDI